MTTNRLNNVNIAAMTNLPSPAEVSRAVPLTDSIEDNVAHGREAVINIIEQRDPRMLVVVGPCSIHDLDAGLEYANRLKSLQSNVADTLLIAMRVYFEKPRTTTGWKGFINDPNLDDSFHIEEGLNRARGFLSQVAALGLPCATEALDPIVPQYLGDLISWYAIGARTSESQTHREMASGLSAPCGFKNATDGNVQLAVNGITSARHGHHFLGITESGSAAVIQTRGNTHAHLILRGGTEPNYDAKSVADAADHLRAANLIPAIMIDCSHGNSNKDPSNQPAVARECVRQRLDGQGAIIGLMLESHLHAGNQKLAGDRAALDYGVSITDACMGWDETAALLTELAESMAH